jgi:flagellar basal-body rod protein FlgC
VGAAADDRSVDAISTALSGMQAASLELDVAANNVANLSTPGFRPSAVSLSASPDGGVAAQVAPGPPTSLGTDPLNEMTTLIVAPLAYAANARVVTASEQMTASLFDRRC